MNYGRLLFIGCLGLLFQCALAQITDPFDNAQYLTTAVNSAVTANGIAHMTITASGDSAVDWRQSYHVRLRNYNDRVEVDPTAPIGSGQYSLYILLFNSSKQFLAEIQWKPAHSDCSTQVLESVSTLAAQYQVQNVEYFWIRFRLHGPAGSGFGFDEIRVLDGPGYWPQTALIQSAPKAVLGHVMTGFRTPEHSGQWSGWNYTNAYVHHDPTVIDANGRPDIASVYYPAIGYYDMKDPQLIEYHNQCMKMACMDGAIFDLGYYEMDPDTVQMMSSYLSTMAQHGLKAVLCYEDKAHWIWNQSATTRAAAVGQAYQDMTNWLNLFLASGTQYMVSGSRPLMLLFSYEDTHPQKGITCLLPDEIETWLDTFPADRRPVLMRQGFNNPDHVGILNGTYYWPRLYPAGPEWSPYEEYCDLPANLEYLYSHREYGQYLMKNGLADFQLAGVWPGFDDLAIWGWGNGPRLMGRYDGQLYNQTWQWAIDDNLPVTQIATWNDWFEGTIIEPSVEFGTSYLAMTSQAVSELKNLAGWTVPDANVPVWIYRLRDCTTDPTVLADLDAASQSIRSGDFAGAQTLVAPWAAYFDVDGVTYWTGPGSIVTAPAIEVPASYSFGDVEFGEAATATLQITNMGTQPLRFTGSDPVRLISGQTHFTITPGFSTADLYVSQSRALSIVYNPQSIGLHSGLLKIMTNDSDSPIIYLSIGGAAILKQSDWNEDGIVDMNDLDYLSRCWLEACGLPDLLLLAERWLD